MKWSEATVKKRKKKKWSEASVGQLGHREYRQLAVSLSLLRTQTRCLAFSEKLADRSERLADSRSLFLPSSWASRQLDLRWIFLEVFEIPFGTLRNANWLQARHFQIQRMLISESTWNTHRCTANSWNGEVYKSIECLSHDFLQDCWTYPRLNQFNLRLQLLYFPDKIQQVKIHVDIHVIGNGTTKRSQNQSSVGIIIWLCVNNYQRYRIRPLDLNRNSQN